MKGNLKLTIELRDQSVATVAVAVGVQPCQLSRIIQSHIEADSDLRRRLAEHLNANEAWLFREVRRVPPLIRPSRKSAHEPSVERAEAANVAG